MKIEIGEIIMAVGLALMVVLAGCLIYCMMTGNDDDRPDWADDTAERLSDKGGVIYTYRTSGDSNYSHYWQDVIPAGQTVYADHIGIVVKNGNNYMVFPYDRIYRVTINT